MVYRGGDDRPCVEHSAEAKTDELIARARDLMGAPGGDQRRAVNATARQAGGEHAG